MGVLSSLFGTGKRAAAESMRAAETVAGSQEQAKRYLMGLDQLPQEIRAQSLEGLQSYFGGFQPQSQEQLIAQAKSSPLYAAILGSRSAGEDAILRAASATGGLRSGNTSANLYDYNVNLENEALLRSFQEADEQQKFMLSGLAGLANMPTYAPEIANLTQGIGQTRGQGIVAAEQARQMAKQQGINNLLKIGELAIPAFAEGGALSKAFSDIRLKRNIRFSGVRGGHNWYKWDWIPEAVKLGLSGSAQGVLAHEVYEKVPEAIGEAFGFLTVDYSQLGVA